MHECGGGMCMQGTMCMVEYMCMGRWYMCMEGTMRMVEYMCTGVICAWGSTCAWGLYVHGGYMCKCGGGGHVHACVDCV